MQVDLSHPFRTAVQLVTSPESPGADAVKPADECFTLEAGILLEVAQAIGRPALQDALGAFRAAAAMFSWTDGAIERLGPVPAFRQAVLDEVRVLNITQRESLKGAMAAVAAQIAKLEPTPGLGADILKAYQFAVQTILEALKHTPKPLTTIRIPEVQVWTFPSNLTAQRYFVDLAKERLGAEPVGGVRLRPKR